MQSDVWGGLSDQEVGTHITGGNFAKSSITINWWLRDFLWAHASQITKMKKLHNKFGFKGVFLSFTIIATLFSSSFAQTCSNYAFASNKVFTTCKDLPFLNSFLHYTYNPSSKTLKISYPHTNVGSSGWVAWAINPTSQGMAGSQALVAFKQSNAKMKGYTLSIDPGGLRWSERTGVGGGQGVSLSKIGICQGRAVEMIGNEWGVGPVGGCWKEERIGAAMVWRGCGSYSTRLQEGDLSFPVSDLSAAYSNNEIVIFAALDIQNVSTNLNHVWQDGQVSNDAPMVHATSGDNIRSMGTLNVLSGQSGSAPGAAGSTNNNQRNVPSLIFYHQISLIYMFFLVFQRITQLNMYVVVVDLIWFYLHVTCQTSAYVIGVAGWANGIQLGGQSLGIRFKSHIIIGIILFCVATLQKTRLFPTKILVGNSSEIIISDQLPTKYLSRKKPGWKNISDEFPWKICDNFR
ncbi:hypothetical protein R6Q59_027250 [Mikania micrantha]